MSLFSVVIVLLFSCVRSWSYACLDPQSSIFSSAIASCSLFVVSVFPIQCAIGEFWCAPSNVTALSAMYLKWCPKSHQLFIIAFGCDSVFIFVSVFHHALFIIGRSFFACA